MKIGLYPGSFNPFHRGHRDIVDKALRVFDRVIIARGINPEKGNIIKPLSSFNIPVNSKRVSVGTYYGTLVEYINEVSAHYGEQVSAVIRGLRNGHDLQHEMNQQYYLEDMGLSVPVAYFLADRKCCHVSSTAERQVSYFDGFEHMKNILPEIK